MSHSPSGVIESGLDILRLVNLMAQDFRPRSLKHLIAECAEGHDWSQSKIHGMLTTLVEAGWVTKKDGYYYLSSHLAKIAYSWTDYISSRAADLILEASHVRGIKVPDTADKLSSMLAELADDKAKEGDVE